MFNLTPEEVQRLVKANDRKAAILFAIPFFVAAIVAGIIVAVAGLFG